jgi:hypothetical protein
MTRVRSQPLVKVQMPAFAQQMDIEIAQHLWEPVGILDDLLAVEAPHSQPVGEAVAGSFDHPGKDAVLVHAGKFSPLLAILVDDAHGLGTGQHGPHAERLRTAALHPEDPEGISFAPRYEAVDGVGRQHGLAAAGISFRLGFRHSASPLTGGEPAPTAAPRASAAGWSLRTRSRIGPSPGETDRAAGGPGPRRASSAPRRWPRYRR